VLLSLAPPDGTTKYVDQITRFADVRQVTFFFSWVRAIFGRYDVFHVHWPEFLLRGRTLPVRFARHLLYLALMLRLRVSSVAVVRTVHNINPHEEGTGLEKALTKLLLRRVDRFILLNDQTPTSGLGAAADLIRHGDYVEAFADLPRQEAERGRLILFGRLQPYKGVETLLRVVSGLPQEDWAALRIVGACSDPVLRETIRAAETNDGRVSADLRFLPDDELVREVTRSEIVILPYTDLHNSGVLLVALSLGRPVVAPRTPSTESLAREVGSAWIYLYEGALTTHQLARGLRTLRDAERPDLPTFDGRDWRTIGAAHFATYQRARAHRRERVDSDESRQTRPVVFINPSGQRTNLGDSVLRRAFLDQLRHRAALHVYTGTHPSYVSGLGLRPEDVVYRSRVRWMLAAVRHAGKNFVFAMNPGEIVEDRRYWFTFAWQLPLIVLAKASRGASLASGIAVRELASRPDRRVRFLLRRCDVVEWRDPRSRQRYGIGTVIPDWAFAAGGPAHADADETRPLLAVSMRGDRRFPSDRWLEAIEAFARRLGASIIVVSQVVGDNGRSRAIARSLGAQVLLWEAGGHLEHEHAVRAVYRRSAAVVSDRIHALIIGVTEGATPIGFTVEGTEKVARTFLALCPISVSFSESEVGSAAEAADRLTRISCSSAEIRAAVATARQTLRTSASSSILSGPESAVVSDAYRPQGAAP